MPESLFAPDLFGEILASALVTHTDWRIRPRFEQREKWSNMSLVARLAPAGNESENRLNILCNARAELSAAFRQKYGVWPNETYVPHVALGYFANEDQAELSSPSIDAWNEAFRERTLGLTLAVRRVAPYGFTDLATFFRRD